MANIGATSVRNGESTSGSTSPHTRHVAVDAETNHNRKRGMVLPFEPHSITFDDVTYSVDMPVVMWKQKNKLKRLVFNFSSIIVT